MQEQSWNNERFVGNKMREKYWIRNQHVNSMVAVIAMAVITLVNIRVGVNIFNVVTVICLLRKDRYQNT